MSRRRISIFGVTGSIGVNTVSVIETLGADTYEVVAVSGNSNIAGLADTARRLRAQVAVTADEGRLDELRAALAGSGIAAAAGTNALVEAASRPVDWVMSAIVGAAGLAPTLAAARTGATIALANKECLVAAGPVFLAEMRRSGATLLPVDSEHNAIFQLTCAERDCPIERLILTASGGPFRDRSRAEMAGVTVAQAMAHPNWSMGARISIDSATMFNKGLEIIEAHYLFDVPYDKIEVVIHPQSILHSAVEFVDGSWKGHFGHPDMRIPIQYALTAPDRAASSVEPFSLAGRQLEFEEPDREVFEAIDLAFSAGRQGGSAPAVLNAADEVAVEAFIEGRLGFLGIADVVRETLEEVDWRELETVDDVLSVDAEARSVAAGLVSGSSH